MEVRQWQVMGRERLLAGYLWYMQLAIFGVLGALRVLGGCGCSCPQYLCVVLSKSPCVCAYVCMYVCFCVCVRVHVCSGRG